MTSNVYTLEYIWIGGLNELRSKTRIYHGIINNINDIPEWNYDGSSTAQVVINNLDTEIIIRPVKYIIDPLRLTNNSFLVLCETFQSSDKPIFNNFRYNANKIFNTDKSLSLEPWFGLEQEYFMVDIINNLWSHDYDLHKGQLYCGIGNKQPLERTIVEEHLQACLYSGLQISGINAEVARYQWEFQIGPSIGIDAADQLWLARYILERIAEKYGIFINYKPKILKEINGSGCHTNFSTILTRSDNDSGLDYIYKYIDKLAQKQSEHIAVYGDGNKERLTGLHETASIEHFTYGIGTRNTSVRIPNQVVKDKKGYFEDRRPAANMDPYLVTSIIFQTCCL